SRCGNEFKESIAEGFEHRRPRSGFVSPDHFAADTELLPKLFTSDRSVCEQAPFKDSERSRVELLEPRVEQSCCIERLNTRLEDVGGSQVIKSTSRRQNVVRSCDRKVRAKQGLVRHADGCPPCSDSCDVLFD